VDFSVIRDTTPPTLTLAAVVQRDVLVTWSATDPSPGSGLDTSKCLLKVREDDEGTWQAFSTDCGGDDTYDGEPGHTYTFHFTASDNVGNADILEVQAVVPYVTKYYYANGQRVAMRQEGVVYYVHTDHLGSVSLVTDHVSEAVARQLYHPYGSPRWSQGTLPTDYGFTGQRLEAGLGLMDYGARFYSPKLGRFISPDPIVPKPGDPQALNRYSYVLNNPMKYRDPSGHWIDTALDLIFIGWDVASIAVDVSDIVENGPSPETARNLGVDIAALAVDVGCLVIPFGTGGGPALRLAFAGGDIAQATVQIPKAVRLGQAALKGIQAGHLIKMASGEGGESGEGEKHHPWPKYLGGPETQELYNLDKELHTEYHRRLDEYLPRRFGTKNYEELLNTPEKTEELLDALLEFNRYFDETYSTHTFETLQDVLRDERLLPRPK
jgi:RHS repeat-associated protein